MTASPIDPTAAITRKTRALLNRHGLRAVEITITPHSFTGRALPDPRGAIVRQRYEQSLAERNTTTIALAEATRLRQEAVDRPVAVVTGKSLVEILDGLARALDE